MRVSSRGAAAAGAVRNYHRRPLVLCSGLKGCLPPDESGQLDEMVPRRAKFALSLAAFRG